MDSSKSSAKWPLLFHDQEMKGVKSEYETFSGPEPGHLQKHNSKCRVVFGVLLAIVTVCAVTAMVFSILAYEHSSKNIGHRVYEPAENLQEIRQENLASEAAVNKLSDNEIQLGGSQNFQDNVHLMQTFMFGIINYVTQTEVISATKQHGLFLTVWIHVSEDKSYPKQCVKATSKLQKLVKEVSKDSGTGLVAGVGYSPAVYRQYGRLSLDFDYPFRNGNFTNVDCAPDGDIFIHAKSDSRGNLRYLAEKIEAAFPSGCLAGFKDIYGFVYRGGRDLSGFIDGTENPKSMLKRYLVAIDPHSGGSFCLAQKWVHRFDVIQNQTDGTLESWVGRRRKDSEELKNKSPTSHVARMTSGSDFGAKKPFEIVRQSMPYGPVGGKSGLFFLAFAKQTNNFNYMLSRMTGTASDGLSDDILKLSRCETGSYWYFPGKSDLKHFD